MFSTQQYFGVDPSTIPGCVLWLDAADSNTLFSDSAGTTLVGASGNVGMWKDKSGGSNHYIQSTSGNRPSFANNTVTCSTSVQHLNSASSTITSITSYDVFAVGKPLPAAGYSWRTLLRGFLGEHPIIVESAATRLGCYTDAGGFTPFGSLTLDGSARALIYLNISANRTQSAALNGTVTTSAATGVGALRTDFYSLGNYVTSGQQWGDINEIIIIENTTLAQRQQVEGYLAWKWGLQLSLPIGHPFKSNPTTMRLFQPIDVADCCLWLDAADLSRFTPSNISSGTTITQWKDKSSNALVCTPSVGVSGNPIIFRTTTGLPSVYINNNNTNIRNVNTDAAISIPVNIQAGFSNFTYVGVFNVGNNGGVGNNPRLQTWYTNYRGATAAGLILLGPNFFELNSASGQWGGADEVVSTSVNNRIVCTFVSDSSRFSWFVNGIPCQIITTTTGTKVSTDVGTTPRIGSTGVDNRNSTGDFYETICYNRAISDQERTNIETYLGRKWNVFLDNAPAITTSQLLVPDDASISANLQVWNDATSYSTNGQVLTTWVNKKAGAPTPQCNGTVLTNQLNSRPIVRLATTATYSTTPVSYSSYTMFFVGRYNGLGNNQRILQGPAGTNILYGYWAGYKHVLYIDNNPSLLNGSGRARLADTLWDVMSHRRVNGGAYTLRFSQSTIYSGATSIAANFTRALINTGSTAETSNCDVAEIIIYDTALSDLQVRQIENYLNEKWNVYPTNKFPFYRAPPAVAVFVPTSLTNLQLWLDAADAATVTGTSPVTAWADKSGTGRNLSVGSGTTTYVSNSVRLNTSYMLVTSAVNLTNASFFIVSMSPNSVNNQTVFGARPNTNSVFGSVDGFGFYIDANAAQVRYYGTTTAGQNITNTSIPTSAPFLSSFTAASTGALSSWHNGTTRGTGATTARTTTAQGFSIGGEWQGASYANVVSSAYIYEVIVYNVVLTTTQRQTVEGYLAWKWGLQNSLPVSHPYSKFRP